MPLTCSILCFPTIPQEFKCKSAQKSFLQCALSNDFDFNKDVWKDTTAALCYTAANTAFTGCRGGTAYEKDGVGNTPPNFAFPSYAVTGAYFFPKITCVPPTACV